MTVAALFVEKGGVYYGLPDVDPWDKERDARLYAGPWPVVAHPPCERWGNFHMGSPTIVAKTGARKRLGDDGGCFASALHSVRRWGGVLEHPANSRAWAAFHLAPPAVGGAWTAADLEGGFTCYVEQGHFGHRARKPTWLYLHGIALPSLGFFLGEALNHVPVEKMDKPERRGTPPPFRELLLAIARTAQRRAHVA